MLGAVRPGLLVIVGALSLGPGAQPVRAASSAPHGVQGISARAALEPGITSEPIQDSHEQEHDHASHDEARETGSWKWVAWLGRLHPMIVHFPIALLTLAAFAELQGMWRRSSRFVFAARFCVWAGALGAFVAAPLGWADALGVGGDYSGSSARILLLHRWAGTATAVLAGVTLLACERHHRTDRASWRRWYHGALFLGALLVALTGHLGSSLIYGWDYLVR